MARYYFKLNSLKIKKTTTYVYQVTQDISLVTVVLLIAGLAPAIHTAWNYVKIKMEEYENTHFKHHYHC